MAVLAGTAMAGCGPGGKPTGDTGSKAARTFADVDRSQWPDATPRRGLAKGLELPLERYMQSYEQRVAIDQAVRDQQTACMATFGFAFRPPPAGTTPPPNPNDANMERRYGITDRVVAEQHGYGLAKGEPPAGASSPKLSEAAAMVLSGGVREGDTKSSAPTSYEGREIPEGGCSGWAPRKVGAEGLDFSLVSRLNYESLARSQEKPKVRAALRSWSRCMKKKGYEVAIPFDAIHLTTGKGNGSEKAVAIALADIDCKKSTDLVSVWYRVDSGIQREQIEQHRAGLETSRKRNEAAVRTAERLLRG
ncbi:hypothetical protein ACIQXD_30030 [Streptomyces uncialis]|uniref:hypothetical protein n=1 Tax=Streptomyces uncialis TaxID=1048205 RepID=UPI0037F697A1